MGLASSQARLLLLTSRESDVEFQIESICQRRTALAYQASQLSEKYANAMYQTDDAALTNATNVNDATTIMPIGALPTNDTAALAIAGSSTNLVSTEAVGTSQYEAQLTQVQSLDKALSLQQNNLEAQHSAVQTEYDSVKKVIDKNIEQTFKTFS